MISANSPKSPLGHAKCPCRPSFRRHLWKYPDETAANVTHPGSLSSSVHHGHLVHKYVSAWHDPRTGSAMLCHVLSIEKSWSMKTCAFHYSKETEHLFKRRAFFSSWLSLPFRSTCQQAAIQMMQTLCPWTLPCFGPWASSKTHCQTIPIVCLGQFCCSGCDVYLAMKTYPWYCRTKSGKPMENIMLFRFLFITCCYFTISTDPQFSPEAIETKLRKASATACPLRCHGRS